MRYRSTLFTSGFVRSPRVSFCQFLRPHESPDLHLLQQNLDAIRMDADHSEYILLVQTRCGADIKSMLGAYLDRGLLKVALYDSTNNERLLNLVTGLASGMVLMTLGPYDKLAPRMATFVWEELLTENERLLIFEKRWKIPKRIAVFRSTLVQVGGFDEGVAADLQVQNLVDRLRQTGVCVLARPHDHLTRTTVRRKHTFSLFRPSPQVIREYKKVETEEFTWLV